MNDDLPNATATAEPAVPTIESDIPEAFKPVNLDDYTRREEMVPMRDGVRLFSVIMIPKSADGAAPAPMVLDRTPYAAAKASRLAPSPRAEMVLYAIHGELVAAGYIVVLQDVRGKHKSEGVYVMNRPLRGPLNPTDTDHATDAFDTIEWLVTNVPESNGRVGTIGISYDGFTALMSLVDPHPALKACVPINPMVDGWKGDDWFRNGAFRQACTLQYIHRQTTTKGSDVPWPVQRYDQYQTWLDAVSAGGMATQLGLDQLPFWKRVAGHPDYDRFWSEQALDRILAARPLTVPTLHVHSQWDAEDIHGSTDTYAALQAVPGNRANNFLVIGPWSHAGAGGIGAEAAHQGASLGAIRFGSETGRWFRQQVLLPFFARHLQGDAAATALPPVIAFETGSNVWRHYPQWPQSGPIGCPHPSRALYLAAGQGLSFEAPTATGDPPDAAGAFDEYVSDPAKPVTYHPRPIRPQAASGSNWDAWLVDDQRFAADRPDVLVYTSAVLQAPLRLAGQPVAHLFASTSGTDSDWVVKLIDVYPDEVPGDERMGGYQLPIAMDVIRGRYRDDPARPSAIPSGEVLRYRIPMPHVSHTLLPGHRLMVQIQSSWFPLYDRNPQTFVPNIMFAQASDHVKATQRVHRGVGAAGFIDLPVVPA
jgi:putative CocE/NonD family hydrolase